MALNPADYTKFREGNMEVSMPLAATHSSRSQLLDAEFDNLELMRREERSHTGAVVVAVEDVWSVMGLGGAVVGARRSGGGALVNGGANGSIGHPGPLNSVGNLGVARRGGGSGLRLIILRMLLRAKYRSQVFRCFFRWKRCWDYDKTEQQLVTGERENKTGG